MSAVVLSLSLSLWLSWVAAGLTAGGVHAVWLWKTAHRPTSAVMGGPLRLAGVATVLVLASLGHGLAPATLGWALGFPGAGLLLLLRGRHS